MIFKFFFAARSIQKEIRLVINLAVPSTVQSEDCRMTSKFTRLLEQKSRSDKCLK